MKLAESMKFVLKKKGQNIFSAIIREDLKKFFKDAAGDIISFVQNKDKTPRLSSLRDSLHGMVLLLKVLPRRINNGFNLFSSEFVKELDSLADQKQKTMFCMKVLAGLSKFALSAAYGVGIGERKLLGLGNVKNIYSQIIMSKLLFKTIQAFIIRFIAEIEKEVTDPVELKSIHGFRDMVMDDSGNAVDKIFDGVIDPTDPAFKIVERFKNYIFTGELD